jgi:hypothetical protein
MFPGRGFSAAFRIGELLFGKGLLLGELPRELSGRHPASPSTQIARLSFSFSMAVRMPSSRPSLRSSIRVWGVNSRLPMVER